MVELAKRRDERKPDGQGVNENMVQQAFHAEIEELAAIEAPTWSFQAYKFWLMGEGEFPY